MTAFMGLFQAGVCEHVSQFQTVYSLDLDAHKCVVKSEIGAKTAYFRQWLNLVTTQ